MPKFSYQAITETGATTSGEIEAESLEIANSMLASRGYIPQYAGLTGLYSHQSEGGTASSKRITAA
jgi:type II secretory pathway component PulF